MCANHFDAYFLTYPVQDTEAMYGLMCLLYYQLTFYILLIFANKSQIILSNIFLHLRGGKNPKLPKKPKTPKVFLDAKKRSHHNFKKHKQLVDWHLEADDSSVALTEHIYTQMFPL